MGGARGGASACLSDRLCANELEDLQLHLQLWLNQDHPDFELIVVNDRSWDASKAYLDEAATKDKRLRVIHLHDHDRDLVGKKFALTIGIKAAKNERVVLTDADCRPADTSWLRRMTDGGDRPFFVLGYGALQGSGISGLLSNLKRNECLALDVLVQQRVGIYGSWPESELYAEHVSGPK